MTILLARDADGNQRQVSLSDEIPDPCNFTWWSGESLMVFDAREGVVERYRPYPDAFRCVETWELYAL